MPAGWVGTAKWVSPQVAVGSGWFEPASWAEPHFCRKIIGRSYWFCFEVQVFEKNAICKSTHTFVHLKYSHLLNKVESQNVGVGSREKRARNDLNYCESLFSFHFHLSFH